MDQIAVLNLARSEFERRLRQVEPGDWDRSTPCEGWTVRDLVLHVIGGSRMMTALVGGCSLEEATAIITGEPNPTDAVAVCGEVGDAQVRAFSDPAALARICHHPAGDFPATVMLAFSAGDFALHAWDLARAIGADETLPDELVGAIWANIEPLASTISTLGVFGAGPSGDVSADAPLQTRLLDATGRRP